MSLGSALSAASSGLRATQAQLDVISNNVANSGTPGYTKRTVNLQESFDGGSVNGVSVEGVQRKLDAILQRELRTETSGSGYTNVRASFATQVAQLFGQPSSSTSLSGQMNGFTSSLQALSTDPGSSTARAQVLAAAQSLASSLNSASDRIQQLRTDAETKIGADVTRVNELLKGIAAVDVKVANSGNADPSLQDQRDSMINELSQYVDLRVTENTNGSVSLTTQGGLRLYDAGVASTFSFDGKGSVTAYDTYSTGASRGVGTITMSVPGGASVDVIGQNVLRSGEIYGLIELRDKTLVDAQGQLDEIAANLSSAMSDRSPTATAYPNSAAQTGLTIDAAGLQRGNVVSVNVTSGTTTKTYSFVMVNGSATLPANSTPDPNDTEIAVDVSGGVSGLAAAIQSALGAGYGVTTSAAPSGGNTNLNVFSTGADKVNSLGGRITSTATRNNVPPTAELPLFVDGATGGTVFTNAVDGATPQKLGYASRIALNPNLTNNPSQLSDYQTGTLAGDNTRVKALLAKLTTAQVTFAPQAGLGTSTSPYTSTLVDYANQVVSAQAANANSAARLNDGQKVVQSSIESRFAAASGVSVDEELSNLIQVQNAYAANARIVSAVKEMMDLLLRI
jgi:flagellar hook-associated protein 1